MWRFKCDINPHERVFLSRFDFDLEIIVSAETITIIHPLECGRLDGKYITSNKVEFPCFSFGNKIEYTFTVGSDAYNTLQAISAPPTWLKVCLSGNYVSVWHI